MTTSDNTVPAPWWRFGYVWLVIAGPAVVVVAGFATLYLALRFPDPVITDDTYRKGLELSQVRGNAAASLAPAVQGRNHAQTGVPVAPPADAPVAAKP
jgi:hypothetical protein